MSKMNAVDEELEGLMARHSAALARLGRGDEVEEVSEFSKVKKGVKELQKDALGYEMLSFLGSESPAETTHSSHPQDHHQVWMAYFKQALEDLLAIILRSTHDDIERQCFVSKVFCWYSDLLSRHAPRRTHPEEETVSENATLPFQQRGYRNVQFSVPEILSKLMYNVDV